MYTLTYWYYFDCLRERRRVLTFLLGIPSYYLSRFLLEDRKKTKFLRGAKIGKSFTFYSSFWGERGDIWIRDNLVFCKDTDIYIFGNKDRVRVFYN